MNLTKKIIIFSLLSSAICLSSCSKFLDESSQDEIKPSTVSDLESLMYSDAYPYSSTVSTDNYLELLTDEYVSNGLNSPDYASYQQNGAAIFQYDPSMFDASATYFPIEADSWSIYYAKIKGCNVVIDYLSKVSGTDTEKNAVLGQALFLRSFYYLKLVMIYGQAYSAPGVNPETSLGVPLILSMYVSDDYPKRNTLKQVYDQIETDLLQAASLLEANYTPTSQFRVGAKSAYALLSRFYLYRGLPDDMQKVVTYASKAIQDGPDLTNLYSFQSSFGSKGIYDLDVSSEVLWVYGTPSLTYSTYYTMYTTWGAGAEPYSVSPTLTNMYDQTNDLRYQSYFYRVSDDSGTQYALTSNKIGSMQNNYGDHGIRMGEIYLNRAEAYARLYQSSGNDTYRVNALADLNKLRESRYAQGTYQYVNYNDASSLLKACYDERFRELCLEDGFRWFDIKRLGLSCTHIYTDAEGNQTVHTLKFGDLLYALPIPYTATTKNYNLQQNPR